MANLETRILKVLIDEGRPEAMANAMKAIKEGETYDLVFETAIEMQNKDYLKILYCVFPGVVNVELTRVGQSAYKTMQSS
jgi:hypothetical protein